MTQAEFVLDASVAAAWIYREEQTPTRLDHLRRAVEGKAIVPAHFVAEIANMVVIGERHGRISPTEVGELLSRLAQVPLVVDGKTPWFGSVADVARQSGLSAYDAAYLELARQTALPLATNDEAMRATALRMSIPLLPR